jgi:hypothetical protein
VEKFSFGFGLEGAGECGSVLAVGGLWGVVAPVRDDEDDDASNNSERGCECGGRRRLLRGAAARRERARTRELQAAESG